MRPGLHTVSLGSSNATASKAQIFALSGKHLHIEYDTMADEVGLQTSKD